VPAAARSNTGKYFIAVCSFLLLEFIERREPGALTHRNSARAGRLRSSSVRGKERGLAKSLSGSELPDEGGGESHASSRTGMAAKARPAWAALQ